MLHTGVDLIEIERIEHAIARHGARLLHRVYTLRELEQCGGRIESLAVRFAAKEAAAKALGTGIWRHGIGWTDLEVVRNGEGAPSLVLHNAAQARAHNIGWREWSVSLTHDRTQAIAFVVAMT